MKFGLINNFSSELAQDLPADGNAMVLSSGAEIIHGALQRADFVALTIVTQDVEIVYAEAVQGSSVVVKRGMEGTTPKAYSVADGAVIEARATAAVLSSGPVNAEKAISGSVLTVGDGAYTPVPLGGGIVENTFTSFSQLTAYDFTTDKGTQAIQSVLESSTGAYLATTGKDSVDQYKTLVFETSTGAQVLATSRGTDSHLSGAFSPDDAYFAFTINYKDTVVIYDTATWQAAVEITPTYLAGRGTLSSPDNYMGIRGVTFISNTEILGTAELYTDLNASRLNLVSSDDPSAGLQFFIYSIVTDTFRAPTVVGPTWLTGMGVYLYARQVKVIPEHKKVAVTYQWDETPTGVVVFDYDTIDGTWTFNSDITDNILALGSTSGNGSFMGLVGGRYLWVKQFFAAVGSGAPLFYVVDLVTNEVSTDEGVKTEDGFASGGDSGTISTDGRYALISTSKDFRLYNTSNADLIETFTSDKLDFVPSGGSWTDLIVAASKSGPTYVAVLDGAELHETNISTQIEVGNYEALQGLNTGPSEPLFLGHAAYSEAASSLAFGDSATAVGDRSVSIGPRAYSGTVSQQKSNVSVGSGARSSTAQGTAVGAGATASTGGVSLGHRAISNVPGGLVVSATPYLSASTQKGLPFISAKHVQAGTRLSLEDLIPLSGLAYAPNSFELIADSARRLPYALPDGWELEINSGNHKNMGGAWTDNKPMVAYAPSGALLVAATAGLFTLIDPESRATYGQVHLLGDSSLLRDVLSMGIHPDGSYLLAGLINTDFNQLARVNLTTFEVDTPLSGRIGEPQSIKFSPDGKYVALGITTTPGYRVLRTSDWQMLTTPFVAQGTCRDVAFTPDGRYLILAASNGFDGAADYSDIGVGYCHVLHADSLIPVEEAAAISDTSTMSKPTAVAVSPDSGIVAIATAESGIEIISTADWARIAGAPTAPPTETPAITSTSSVAFSPDGALLAVGHSQTEGVTIYATSDWSVRHRISPATYPSFLRPVDGTLWGDYDYGIFSLAFSSDSHTLVMGTRGRPAFATVDLRREVMVTPDQPEIYGNSFNSTAFSSSGETFYVKSSDTHVSIFDLNNDVWVRRQELDEITATATIAHMAISKADNYLALSHDSTTDSLTVYSLPDLVIVSAAPTDTANIRNMAFSNDGSLLALSSDSYVRVLDTTSWATVQTLTGLDYAVPRFTPNDQKLVACDATGIKVYLTADWSPVTGLETVGERKGAIEISPDSTKLLVAGNNDTTLYVYDLVTMQLHRSDDGKMYPGTDFSSSFAELTGITYILNDEYLLLTYNKLPGIVIVNSETLEYAYELPSISDHLLPDQAANLRLAAVSDNKQHVVVSNGGSDKLIILSQSYATSTSMLAYSVIGGKPVFSGSLTSVDCLAPGDRSVTSNSYPLVTNANILFANSKAYELSARVVTSGYLLEPTSLFKWGVLERAVSAAMPTTVTGIAVSDSASLVALGINAPPFLRLFDTAAGTEIPLDLTGMNQSPVFSLTFSANGGLLLATTYSGSAAASAVSVISTSSNAIVSSAMPAVTSSQGVHHFSTKGPSIFVDDASTNTILEVSMVDWSVVREFKSPQPAAPNQHSWLAPDESGAYFLISGALYFRRAESNDVSLELTLPSSFERLERTTTPDGRYGILCAVDLSGQGATQVYTIDYYTLEVVGVSISLGYSVSPVVALPDSRHIILGGRYNAEKKITILDIVANEVVHTSNPINSGVASLAIIPNSGAILAGVQSEVPTAKSGLSILEVPATEGRGSYTRSVYAGLT